MSILSLKLIKDIGELKLPTDFILELKGYSKIYNGRYYPPDSKIVIYAENSIGEWLDYQIMLETAIHEAIHHYQWKHCEDYFRKKGVMHDKQFKELENNLIKKARLKYGKHVRQVAKINT